MNIQIRKLDLNAIIPEYAYKDNNDLSWEAGIDLFALKDGIIIENNCSHIETGIAIQFDYNENDMRSVPWNMPCFKPCFFIKGKSGLSFKHNIEIGAGVIDSTYQGEIKIKAYNFSSVSFKYKRGDKIAQLVPLLIPVIHNIKIVGNFKSVSKRNIKGFGSSDKKE